MHWHWHQPHCEALVQCRYKIWTISLKTHQKMLVLFLLLEMGSLSPTLTCFELFSRKRAFSRRRVFGGRLISKRLSKRRTQGEWRACSKRTEGTNSLVVWFSVQNITRVHYSFAASYHSLRILDHNVWDLHLFQPTNFLKYNTKLSYITQGICNSTNKFS
jgi:hypothetical protein